MLHIGTTLDGRYRIDYVIKQGGMGTVYGAHDLRLDRPCAVKAMPAQSDGEALQFQREARVLGRLCHPHLPAIFDCIEEHNVVFVIMQMIPGDDLEGVTGRHGAPPWEVLVAWGLQLAEALQYLHHQSPPVIHRDIKPANIRLADHGQIYLVDFGIAKLLDGAATVTAARAASVPYAPIEQVQEGSHTDKQSDIYSFGATLYRVLTGKLPPSCIDRLVGKELAPITSYNPAVPEALERLILDCMELWNTDRPAKIGDVIKRLQALRAAAHKGNGQTVQTKAPSQQPSRRPEPRRSEPEATADGAFRAGKQALERGDATAAQTYFSHAINLARTFAEAYAARATAHSCLGHVNAAIEDWDAAIAQGPRRAAWYAERAALQRGRGDAVAAHADLTTAISLDPDVAEYYVDRAAVRRDLGDGRGQLQDLDRAMLLQPDHPAGRLARARARIEQQLWQSAVSDCNAIIQNAPDAAIGFLLRARVYAELGDAARALRDVAQALTNDPRAPEGYFLRGRLLQRSGDRQAALRDYGVALSLAPDFIEARYHRAQLYRSLRAGQEEEALLDFKALWQSWHGDHDPLPIPQRQLATEINYLMQAGSEDKARRVLQAQAGSFREDSEDELHERASLYERVGQLDFALDDWERLARLILSRQSTPQMAVS